MVITEQGIHHPARLVVFRKTLDLGEVKRVHGVDKFGHAVCLGFAESGLLRRSQGRESLRGGGHGRCSRVDVSEVVRVGRGRCRLVLEVAGEGQAPVREVVCPCEPNEMLVVVAGVGVVHACS